MVNGGSWLRIQPVDATHLRLLSSEECCNETEAADLLYRRTEGVNVGALAQGRIAADDRRNCAPRYDRLDVSACCSFSSTIASLVRPSPTRRFSSICAAMSNDRCWRVAASADEKWAGSCGLFVVYTLAARIQLQHCAPYQMMNGRDAR